MDFKRHHFTSFVCWWKSTNSKTTHCLSIAFQVLLIQTLIQSHAVISRPESLIALRVAQSSRMVMLDCSCRFFYEVCLWMSLSVFHVMEPKSRQNREWNFSLLLSMPIYDWFLIKSLPQNWKYFCPTESFLLHLWIFNFLFLIRGKVNGTVSSWTTGC